MTLAEINRRSAPPSRGPEGGAYEVEVKIGDDATWKFH